MPLVEGLGDEVTIILGLLTIIIVLLIAWLSTHTRDIPFFSVIVVELSQRAARNQQSRSRTPETQRQLVQESVESSVTPAETVVAQHQDARSTKSSSLVKENISGADAGDRFDSLPTTEQSSESQPSLPVHAQDGPSLQSTEDSVKITEDNATQDAQSATGSWSESVTDSKHVTEGASSESVSSVDSKKDDSDCHDTSPSERESEIDCHPSTQTVVSGDSDNTAVRHRQVPSNQSGPSLESVSPPTPPDNATNQNFLDSANDDHMGQIRIRLKYLNDTQRLVYSSPTDTIGQFRRAHFSTELAANKLVRLIFNGQDMRNDTNTLQGYNITDNSVIHCLITQNLQGTAQQPTDNGDGDVQLGSFMMPLFAIILAAMWYLRITQRQYFNAVSTLSLAGVTFLFLLGCASVWRTGGNREHQHVD